MQLSNDLVLIIGLILGQAMTTAILVYFLQKKKQIAYWPAFRAYVKSEQGGYIIAMVGLLILMFVLPDYVSPDRETSDTLSEWKYKKSLSENFRLFSVVFGAFSTILWLLLFKKGINAIKKEDEKLDAG